MESSVRCRPQLPQEAPRGRRTIIAMLTAVTLSLLGGCRTTLQETHAFPATWPGSRPLGENAPTVSVQPFQMDVKQVEVPTSERQASEGNREEPEGLPSAAVLTVLFIKHLHANGVNAILEPSDGSTAQYTLGCAIPQLGYGERQPYPRQRLYKSELVCTLKDEETQTVVWKRSLAQHYEETALFNMMTKIPAQPYEPERVLFRECIVPLWDAMASSVGTAVVSREQTLRNRNHDRAKETLQSPGPAETPTSHEQENASTLSQQAPPPTQEQGKPN